MVKFIPKDSKELKSATLISRFMQSTVTSKDFDQYISSMEIVPNFNSNIEEIHY